MRSSNTSPRWWNLSKYNSKSLNPAQQKPLSLSTRRGVHFVQQDFIPEPYFYYIQHQPKRRALFPCRIFPSRHSRLLFQRFHRLSLALHPAALPVLFAPLEVKRPVSSSEHWGRLFRCSPGEENPLRNSDPTATPPMRELTASTPPARSMPHPLKAIVS